LERFKEEDTKWSLVIQNQAKISIKEHIVHPSIQIVAGILSIQYFIIFQTDLYEECYLVQPLATQIVPIYRLKDKIQRSTLES